MTREEAIKFAEYAQIMADGKPDVQEFYKLAESALRQQEEHFRDLTKKIEPMTNADMIRAMSDEELADFLAYTWATSARAWQKDPGETMHWIQMPAEEDDHE